MSALTQKSPIETSSAFGLPAPPAQQPLTQLPQPGENPQVQSALMQGLTNYFKGQTAAAGDPNANPPSMGSALMQSAGNGFDNSATGGFVNSMMGNAAGNGYGAQAAGGAAGSSAAGSGAASAADMMSSL